MKRILINSNVNFEATALMCAHVQNIQTHSVVITDSFNLLRYGERVAIEPEKVVAKNLTNIYCNKHDDVIIIVAPDILKATTPDEIEKVLTNIEMLITEEFLETIEASTVYLSSAILSLELLQNFADKYEATLVDFNNYKSSSVFTDKFNWTEGIEDADKVKIIAYTCIFDKKLHKKAAELKRPVLLITARDLLIMMDRERLNDWKVTGLARSLAVDIICKHTGVNKEAVESWISATGSK